MALPKRKPVNPKDIDPRAEPSPEVEAKFDALPLNVMYFAYWLMRRKGW